MIVHCTKSLAQVAIQILTCDSNLLKKSDDFVFFVVGYFTLVLINSHIARMIHTHRNQYPLPRTET